jgi:PIN domain nuclease of toxin-antitoxin system
MILNDTHIVVWLAETPDELSDTAREAIRVARNRDGLAISDKTLWELAMLIDRGTLTVQTSLQEFLREVERNFVILPVTSAIAERSVRFSSRYSKDPADCIIGATALVHRMPLVTKDGIILASGEVPTIW